MSCMNMCIRNPVIIQGSTPTLIIDLDYDISDPQTEKEQEYKDYWDVDLVIKYSLTDYFHYTKENDLTILPDEVNEEKCGCQCRRCTVYVDLTQEQTLKMKKKVYLQIEAKNMNSGFVLKTYEVPLDVYRTLDRTVM